MKKNHNTTETINQIIAVSTALFVEKGYEKTTIQDIVNGLDGLSRGAIYHHFSSKEAIVDEVIDRMLPNTQYVTELSQEKGLNGLEKIQQLFLEPLFHQKTAAEAASRMTLLDNPKLFLKHMKHITDKIAPEIEAYIVEGNQDGSVNVSYPKQMAEIIIFLLSTWFTIDIYPNSAETFADKVAAAKLVLANSGVDVLSDEVLQEVATIIKQSDERHGKK